MISWPNFLTIFVLATVLTRAGDTNLLETTRLAGSLDELVRQTPPFPTQVLEKGKRTRREGLPVQLERITPVAAKILKVNEPELRELLADDREKLSQVVYACLLAEKRNKSWRGQLVNGEDLYREVQKEIPVADLYRVLDHLYVELAFAALDSPVRGKRAAKTERSAGEVPK